MKYVILIGDGMADEPLDELGGRTPLEYARTPNMDAMASGGRLGLFRSVPEGYPPGSDVANLSILGYDPKKYYTGRAPLEAASIGVSLGPSDVAFRCNLVSLAEHEGSFVMDDYSAGHITTEEAALVMKTLDEELSGDGVRFYAGKSYRHLMVWQGGPDGITAIPPHDISDREIDGHLPTGEGSDRLRALMARSWEVLRKHPVNKKRGQEGRKRADSIWLWGQGRAPGLPTLTERFGLEGGMISAVDLMNGIGAYAGLERIEVPGMTGYLDTDYGAKASYALDFLRQKDFVCVHVEAPDEAGHQGLLKDKLRAIEDFDAKVVGPVLEGLKGFGEYRALVISDHPTPVRLKTHTRDPVPFAVFGTGVERNAVERLPFTEGAAVRAGLLMEDPAGFMEAFFGRPPA